MPNPYESLPEDRFWRSAVAERDALEISGLWKPKLRIGRRSRIITAGSCFAQHFAKALRSRGFRWADHEPGPPGLTAEQRHDFHYGTFSFRTGNIYTPRMLLQWLSWALGGVEPPDEVWEDAGRYVDPFRPSVEPGGFASKEELQASRRETLAAIQRAIKSSNVLVFTLGLTEAWQNQETGVEYAICPGTLGGSFDPEKHVFVNHRYAGLMADMNAALRLLLRANKRLFVLLTVSPVPLTATASGNHVLTATSQSKSVLRAVAAELAIVRPRIDYFPSYEIITHPAYGGRFYAPNKRSVTPEGVDHVMRCFFADQATAFAGPVVPEPVADPLPDPPEAKDRPQEQTEPELSEAEELRCEEEILAAFAPQRHHD